MSLRKKLDEGQMVVGSLFDGKIRNLSDMDEGHARRYGYMDEGGFWTDRGYDRATSTDYDRLDRAREAFQRRQDGDN